jgi:hypothetical protein
MTEAMAMMRRDELETFARPIRQVNFICTETVFKDDRQGHFMVFSSVERGAGAPASAFAGVLTDGFAAQLLAHPALGSKIARLAVCLRSELATAMGAGRQHDALVELSFHSLDDAVAVFASDAYAAIAKANDGAILEVERCVTRELLLDDVALFD